MLTLHRSGMALVLAACSLMAHAGTPADDTLRGKALDQRVGQLMQAAHVPGMALGIIENGKVTYLRAYGYRDVEKRLPLTTDTVMYAASTTKAAFAYSVMTLVDGGKLDMDASIATLLPKPLPDYEKYADLKDEPRWQKITPRILLTHSAGFANFRFWPREGGYDPNGKLMMYFDPGTRFAYSGEGINLLQFVLENGEHTDVATLMQKQLFDRFDMKRTSMTWRDDFAGNLAIGFDEKGKALDHKQRSSVRAAGSMDTTPHDFAHLIAGMVRGDGLSAQAHALWLKPALAVHSVQSFPTLDEATTQDNDGIALSAALGVMVYQSPQGPAWFKTGHDDGTNNLALCLQASRRCIVIMSNSSNSEGIYRYLIDAVLGPTCYPWYWENDIPYDHPEWRTPDARKQPHPPCAPLTAPTFQ
ncbi:MULTISPECIES: serine hydrolase domain-containing protein [Dyella]|uniref:Class A beta-lactamase-related serine hydrolase n=2 Tax=Dyella TaxID=231454 RepID=A0A4R0Z1W2_9GAMM|nr:MULTISPECIES: serine hydrolase domain-containing protein [Dyella]TBR39248.1 class A beta-lactamase-related serine hydrolase [Dyella terrae]TCI13166.1 class A beta-lactamase-related serine hydrolase [Dyella soli]